MNLLAALPDGTLALGYGDFDANTGPIDLLGLDPVTGAWSVLYEAMPTEAIDKGRIIDGRLWVPSTDPVGTGPGTIVTNSPAGTWRLLTVSAAALHLFDVAGEGSVRYTCGSRSAPTPAAVVYKSTDGGTVWTEDIAYVGDSRFYDFRRLDGDVLCVSSSDFTKHWTLDAGTWTEHAGQAPGSAPEPITHNGHAYWTNGETVYQLATE